ncbi:hypothetical protein AKJ51_03455 [candidate division MSBL1 archaeon SCGC-AAA382A20]|uniref:Uncharacterized protein n=1 Tax=candidate division MSBL1 archaeon SCGC-AAA382A20 TaxID=1698280 RepID=A0A133VJC9_9EURY|nr:hypothetical protein AKJ51_03455 [candidate division MSBL1 archaeon SCGC-AAA382A20]
MKEVSKTIEKKVNAMDPLTLAERMGIDVEKKGKFLYVYFNYDPIYVACLNFPFKKGQSGIYFLPEGKCGDNLQIVEKKINCNRKQALEIVEKELSSIDLAIPIVRNHSIMTLDDTRRNKPKPIANFNKD